MITDKTDKIPILMITHNRLPYTKKSIESVLDNTDFSFELFIWDNGSTDGTIGFLKGLDDKRIRIHYSEKNVGLVHPINDFLERYKNYTYVSKVDNDTIVPKGWLTKLREVMEKYPLFAIQADHYIGLDYKLKDRYEFFNCLPSIDFNGKLIYLSHFCGGTGILIRRSLIDEPIPEAKGTLSGWVLYCTNKFREKNYIYGFYTGVFIELLDMAGSNKKIYDFPEYKKELEGMGRGEFSTIPFDRDKFLKLGESIKAKFESLL